jgi:hypothetical protein
MQIMELKSLNYSELIEDYEDAVEIYGSIDTYLEQINNVPTKVRNLIVLDILIGEVLNGGFLQFFRNPSGIVAPEALVALDAINQPKARALLETAMVHFGSSYPRDCETRRRLFKDTYLLDGKLPSPFDHLDSEFYKFEEYGQDTWSWLDQYAEFGE